MSRHLKIWVALLTLSLALPVLSWSQAAPQNAGGGNAPPPPSANKPPQPQTDQTTNIAYYTLRDGMNSTLTLNNLAPTQTNVTVTLFNVEGRAQVLDPVVLDPKSFRQIELREVVKSELFDSGNIQIAFHGIPMVVTCQVSVYSLEKRVSFQSREQDNIDFASLKLNGILSLPRKDAQGFLAVTNVSKNKLMVQLSVAGGSRPQFEGTRELEDRRNNANDLTKEVALYPRETRLIRLDEELGLHAPATALVKLSQNGLPGDIITTGFVMDLKDGYSSAFAMADSVVGRTSHLSGVHFRFGQPDPGEGFPVGTTFTSPLLLANVSDKPVAAHVSVDYTVAEKLAMTPIDPKQGDTQDKFSTVAVKDVTIGPGAIERIELAAELAKLGVATPAKECGVDIDYQAPPGSLIGNLVSVDQTGDYSFEVPIKDPTDFPGIESTYPWKIENDTNTVLHLKNTTKENQRALALLSFPDGGTYQLGPTLLEPYQSFTVDLQKLKESKKPDMLGHSFPADATRGLLFWVQQTPYSMIGRAEQVNVKTGIASSFSCGDGCCQWWSQRGFWVNPSSLSGPIHSGGSFEGRESYVDCFGTLWQNQYTYPSQWQNWRTSNSSVATVSAGNSSTDIANVSYVGGGTATINADFYDNSYDWNQYCVCQSAVEIYYGTVAPQVTVCVPASVRITQDITTDVVNTAVTDYCSGQYETIVSGSHNGLERCLRFQLVDSCGHDITTGGYTASESRVPSPDVSPNMRPSGQSVVNGPNRNLPAGNWIDVLWYIDHPAGDFLKVRQTVTVTNNNTGAQYQVGVFCQDFETSPLAINQYAGPCH